MSTRFYIETYGCTLNRHDSDIMRKVLVEHGFFEVDNENDADVLIINTCGVKDATEKRIIHRLQNVKKPVVVCGCIATANAKLVRKFAPDSVIVSTKSIGYIPRAVDDAIAGLSTDYFGYDDKNKYMCAFCRLVESIAVCEGCKGSCTYCFTKIARPGLKSMLPEEILRRVRIADEAGVKELRLTAQDMGAYGHDIGTRLTDLLEKIARMNVSLKIRVGMINPQHLVRNMEIIDIIRENDVFYKFYHIPVQSGSDEILKKMNREYSVDDFMQVVRGIRKDRYSNIMTDVIVGFPGEREEDFRQTIELVKKIEPDTTNVSKFSPRPGTVAFNMDRIDGREVKKRSVEMSRICDAISLERNCMWVGKVCSATVLEDGKGHVARNDYYKHIVLGNSDINLGERVKVKIISGRVAHVKGKIIED
ncbi:MAG: tRNA (N(6)-L-threonylcarbamoyladenosine(37)-C(2))-methylthiotransferase [Candidatus Micrarchaeia archaeon]